MLTNTLRKIINQNPELLPFKQQLVGCCKRRVSNALIIKRVKQFIGTHPQYRDILAPVMK